MNSIIPHLLGPLFHVGHHILIPVLATVLSIGVHYFYLHTLYIWNMNAHSAACTSHFQLLNIIFRFEIPTLNSSLQYFCPFSYHRITLHSTNEHCLLISTLSSMPNFTHLISHLLWILLLTSVLLQSEICNSSTAFFSHPPLRKKFSNLCYVFLFLLLNKESSYSMHLLPLKLYS